MTRVIVADGCQQVDSPSGRRYYARGASAFEGTVRGGVFDMTPADAKLAVAMGGAVAGEAGTARRSLGWRCPACGFGSFLKRCGRCGGECRREGETVARPAARADQAQGEDPGEDQEGADHQEAGGEETPG